MRFISNHFFGGVLYKDTTYDAGEKEQLLELNEANHVYGSHAELDVKAYDSYCTTQRDRFRYLEVPWSEEGRVWVVWGGEPWSIQLPACHEGQYHMPKDGR